MRLFIDGWDPGYGSSGGFEDPTAESSARLVLDVERPRSDWSAIEPATNTDLPAAVLFVDGVRRIDTYVTLVESGSPSGDLDPRSPGGAGPRLSSGDLGICASYASGVVVSTSRGADVTKVNLRRGLFTTAVSAQDITTRIGSYDAHVVAVSEHQAVPDALSLALQHQLALIEVDSATSARDSLSPGDDLLVIDGPVRAREHLPRAIGMIKTHRARYLPPELDAVVGALAAGERSPVFAVGTSWDRYTWYLRLPALPGAPWKGVVRVECSSALSPPDAIRLATLSQAVLPRFASAEHKDPRAPQNLVPIGGLEQHLRHRLGDRELLVRALRESAH